MELLAILAMLSIVFYVLAPVFRQARADARLVQCMAHQRKVAAGALVYADANQAFPPSIAQRSESQRWVMPDRLNFLPGMGDGAAGGSVGRYLASYVPDADAYYCPLAPGVPDGHDVQYHEGKTDYLPSSYYLLWNYRGLRGFSGPASPEDADKVLTSDAFHFVDLPGLDRTWRPFPQWRSCHPFRGAEAQLDHLMIYKQFGDAEHPPEFASDGTALQVCSSFADGSVSRQATVIDDAPNLVSYPLKSNPGIVLYFPYERGLAE